jgi:plastocyanin
MVLILAGCGGGASPRHVSAYAMRHPQIVPHAGGYPDGYYVPNPIHIRVGQSVTWTNLDNDPHTVTADDGTFDSGAIAYHASWRWIFARPGTYTYFCTLHPRMHGIIVVTK